jgi:TonB family protein
MMASHPGEISCPVPSLDPEPELRLLLELEPRGSAFGENLAYFFRKPRAVRTSSPPAKFWPDVFVPTGLPWGRLSESMILHVLAVVALITVTNAVSLLLPRAPKLRMSEKIYHYDLSNYLPPMETPPAPAPKPRKGRPLLAKQRIISLPPRPDNFEQTVLSPVDVKLPTNIKLPNIVAWTERPGVPSAVVARTVAELKVPSLPVDVIPPAPDPVNHDLSQLRAPNVPTKIIEPPPEVSLNPRAIHAPLPAVIEPPPDSNVAANIGSMNVGHLTATVVAPKIEVAEQKVITLKPSAGGSRSAVPGGGAASAPPVAPVGGINTGPNTGQLIALNLHPAVPNGPISVPPGRRSGEFAVGPEGASDAPGTPDVKAGGNGSGGEGKENATPLAGITIGDAPGTPKAGPVVVAGDPDSQPHDPSKDKQTLMASARPPRTGEIPRNAGSTANVPEAPRSVEDRVFGGKQIYTLALNMPNLASTGGSWVIRFAQLDDDHVKAPISAPVATRTVDPAYPADLIREGFEGTVTLYAVIHKDGTVGEVRVLRGLQVRLDENARVALSRWKFRPATKNGEAVDLEAVVQIPFKATRIHY